MEISIIIPCYNHGMYIRDAINSVKDIKGVQFEIIIVNDGSTDEYTKQVLNELECEGFTVIHQINLGLGAARNAGIQRAKGKYILPLDSDNKVQPEYIFTAIEILENNISDIVYGNPEFFGEVESSRLFKPSKFDIYEIFNYNYIDACAVYRKIVWEKNCGYETNMPFPGHEDWEFWINAFKNGFKFEYIDKEFYYYRILSDSMIVNTIKNDKHSLNLKYIINKHLDLYICLFYELNYFKKKKLLEQIKPLRTAIKYLLIWMRIKK